MAELSSNFRVYRHRGFPVIAVMNYLEEDDQMQIEQTVLKSTSDVLFIFDFSEMTGIDEMALQRLLSWLHSNTERIVLLVITEKQHIPKMMGVFNLLPQFTSLDSAFTLVDRLIEISKAN